MLQGQERATRELSPKTHVQELLQALIDKPSRINDASCDELYAAIRAAHFTEACVQVAYLLLSIWHQMFAAHETGKELTDLRDETLSYQGLLTDAYQKGLISAAWYRSNSTAVAHWQKQVAPKTQAQLTTSNRQRNAEAEPLFRQARAVLAECEEYRRYVDKHLGRINTGGGDATVGEKLIGALEDTHGQLGGAARDLQQVLALPDTDEHKRDRVRVANDRVHELLAQVRREGVTMTERVDASREYGFALLDRAALAVGFIPGIGKPLSVALKATGAGLRYASGDWTAWEAVTKTLLAVVDAKFGDKIAGGGSLVAQGLRSFVWNALQSAAGEITGILANPDPDFTPEQRVKAVDAALMKALVEGFTKSIGRITQGAIKVGSEEEVKELYVFFHEAAMAVGIEQRLYGPLEELKNAWKEKP